MYLLQGLKTGFECPDDNNGATVGGGRRHIAAAIAGQCVDDLVRSVFFRRTAGEAIFRRS